MSHTKRLKVAVIGAGPAGLSAAYKLSKNGIKVDVYESTDSVGGMAKSIDLWGCKIDLGPHRYFSSDHRVNQLWLEIVANDYRIIDRVTHMYYDKKFYRYPLDLIEVVNKLGIYKIIKCSLSFLRYKLRPLNGVDLETWLINQFGKELYNIFFKNYNIKLWGVNPKDLDSEFGKQRIKHVNFYNEIRKVFTPKTRKLKTLEDQFAYPIKGTGMVYDRMSKKIKEFGNNIFLNNSVQQIYIENGKVTGLATGTNKKIEYDYIISSMPLNLLVKNIPNVPDEIIRDAEQLTFRNTIIVYLCINQDNLFKDQWLYIHSPELKTGRITNFNNFGEVKKGQTILGFEYWCNMSDEMWNKPDIDIIEIGKNDAAQSGLLRNADIVDSFVIRIPRSYPVYLSKYRKILKPIVSYFREIDNLMIIGRYGSFKYNNQDHSILMGILAAENIISKTKNNLWEVNTNDEYQEKSIITSQGLKRIDTDESKSSFW